MGVCTVHVVWKFVCGFKLSRLCSYQDWVGGTLAFASGCSVQHFHCRLRPCGVGFGKEFVVTGSGWWGLHDNILGSKYMRMNRRR